jgi:hypothetical protein
MNIPFMKCIAFYLAFLVFLIGITPRVDAGFAPSETTVLPQLDRSADLQKVQKVLEMKAVKERLRDLGFAENEIQQRLGQLSDEQMHYLAQNIDELRVGGNGLGLIVVLLVIAILVVLLIQLTGHRIIVK